MTTEERGAARRHAMMDALEQLTYHRQIDALGATDIRRAVGARNNSVVQYHFGSFEGLVAAAIDRKLHLFDQPLANLIAQAIANDFRFCHFLASAAGSLQYRPLLLAARAPGEHVVSSTSLFGLMVSYALIFRDQVGDDWRSLDRDTSVEGLSVWGRVFGARWIQGDALG